LELTVKKNRNRDGTFVVSFVCTGCNPSNGRVPDAWRTVVMGLLAAATLLNRDAVGV
jgi:hypothetical protein